MDHNSQLSSNWQHALEGSLKTNVQASPLSLRPSLPRRHHHHVRVAADVSLHHLPDTALGPLGSEIFFVLCAHNNGSVESQLPAQRPVLGDGAEAQGVLASQLPTL